MAEDTTMGLHSGHPSTSSPSPLGSPVDFVRSLGRQLPLAAAPEGWVRRIDRQRAGKVWVGFFHLWTTDADGRRVRQQKEKTLGPASMPKHEAQKKLADYIEEYAGLLTKQAPLPSAIATFGDLWTAFCTVKSGFWSKKTKEDLNYLFGKHVLPVLGHQPLGKVTYTSLQLLVNKLAADGYGETTVTRTRTYIKASFEYALDEDLVIKNPARKLEIPTIQKDVCERFLSLEEIGALLSEAEPREHLVLHILAACGLRPAEVLVLRIEDFDGTKLRIDEALKDREKNEARIGRTKTKASNSSVPTPPDLSREITSWIAAHPERANPRAFLFPNRRKTPLSVGNYLKRHLKPLAEKVGIHDLTHQAFRRTSSTHIQDVVESVKDLQGHLRHTNPQTTLKHYTKVIPESLRTAVAALGQKITTAANASKQRKLTDLSQDESTDSKRQRTESKHVVSRVVSIDAWRKLT
jgi:integrase